MSAPKTASSHNADLTGRVEMWRRPLIGEGTLSESELKEQCLIILESFDILCAECTRLESENALLRERLAAKTDGEGV